MTGWAFDGESKYDQIVIVSAGKKICSSKPNVSRPDINPKSPEFIGFTCNVHYKISSEPINLNIYAIRGNGKYYSKLNIIDFVSSSLSNEYNEKCYLKYNQDVKIAQDKGVISGYDHWKRYGFTEGRRCYSLSLQSEGNKIELSRYSLKNHFLFEFISDVYHVVLSYLWPLIIISLFLMLFTHQIQIALILFIFVTAILSRIVLISALDVVGMAPVSGMYLASGVYFYFISFVFSILFLFNEFLKKIKRYHLSKI